LTNIKNSDILKSSKPNSGGIVMEKQKYSNEAINNMIDMLSIRTTLSTEGVLLRQQLVDDLEKMKTQSKELETTEQMAA